MKDRYVSCYLSGRSDEYEEEVDIPAIVDKAISSGAITIRESTHAAAKAAIATEMDPTAKMQWLKDNLDAIKEMGGDTERAWRVYNQGRIDMLAYELEDQVLTAIVDSEDESEDSDDSEEDFEEEEDSE